MTTDKGTDQNHMNKDQYQLDVNGIRVPVPDPTVLTTQQLIREQLALRELLETEISSVAKANDLHREIIETRLDGMDLAIRLLQDTADKFPARIEEKIVALSQVVEGKLETLVEKFESVQKQFNERDVRTEQAAGAVKIAVDAALQAQKEAASEQSKSNAAATTKSEASTTKLIDAQAALIATMTKAFDDKIADVKDRITRVEGGGEGKGQAIGYLFAGLGALIGLAGLAFGLLRG